MVADRTRREGLDVLGGHRLRPVFGDLAGGEIFPMEFRHGAGGVRDPASEDVRHP